MPKFSLDFLQHALDEIAFLESQTSNLTEELFMRDELLQRAFARSLEIIGEAVKHIPEEVRSIYPLVDWKSYAGLRDRLIHHYFGIDYALVWDVIVHELPDLKEKLRLVLAGEKN